MVGTQSHTACCLRETGWLLRQLFPGINVILRDMEHRNLESSAAEWIVQSQEESSKDTINCAIDNETQQQILDRCGNVTNWISTRHADELLMPDDQA